MFVLKELNTVVGVVWINPQAYVLVLCRKNSMLTSPLLSAKLAATQLVIGLGHQHMKGTIPPLINTQVGQP